MSVNQVRDFIFEKHYERIGFFKETYSIKILKKYLLLLANKLIEKIPDPSNAEH